MADFILFFLSLFAILASAQAAALHVGPDETYKVPSAAAAVAQDGDTIDIAAGTYRGDVAVWRASGLTIKGTGGRPVLDADGKSAEGKAIWVVKGDFTTIENIAFMNEKVGDRNGAGIREEGRDLIVSHCLFRNNQEGILSGSDHESQIYIEDSEFDHNGAGDGYSHNLYIGEVGKLVVKRCYLHNAVVGHNLKSRALESVVTDSRIADEMNGNSSYDLDFPNGGKVLLAFNVIQQGPHTENSTIIAYGAEGLRPSGNVFVAKGNTVINQRPGGGRFLFLAIGTQLADLVGNIFVGKGEVPDLPEIRKRNDFTMALPPNANWRP